MKALMIHGFVYICYFYAGDRVGMLDNAVTVRYVTIVQKVGLDSTMQ
jgi:hypothetical protein